MLDMDRRLCKYVEGGTWELPVPSTQFCCEPKTALKIRMVKKKKRTHTDIYTPLKIKK